jgi:alpha-N-acetylglucosamine transferase
MPWATSQEHTPKQTFDEESNRRMTVMVSGLPRTHFKLLGRIILLILTLLILGVLAQFYLQFSAKLNLTILEDPLLEPDNDWSLSYDTTAPSDVDWAKYAYTQYVTNSIYLCNSLMVFESLHRLGSKAERLMMYPEEWSIEAESSGAWLLRRARDEYDVKLQPVQIQRLEGDITWGESFTKLLAFNQTQYKRVISLDSVANVLQVNTVLHDLLCITLKC